MRQAADEGGRCRASRPVTPTARRIGPSLHSRRLCARSPPGHEGGDDQRHDQAERVSGLGLVPDRVAGRARSRRRRAPARRLKLGPGTPPRWRRSRPRRRRRRLRRACPRSRGLAGVASASSGLRRATDASAWPTASYAAARSVSARRCRTTSHLDAAGRGARAVAVDEAPELLGAPERQHDAVADAQPGALSEVLVDDDLVVAALRARALDDLVAAAVLSDAVEHRERAGQPAVARGGRRARSQAPERAAGGPPPPRGVPRSCRARRRRRRRSTPRDDSRRSDVEVRRAEVDEQLGDVGVGGEPVVGRAGAATGGDHAMATPPASPARSANTTVARHPRRISPAARIQISSTSAHPSCPTSSHSTAWAAAGGIRRAGVSAGGARTTHVARCAGWDRIQPWIATPVACSPLWTGRASCSSTTRCCHLRRRPSPVSR